MSRLIGKLLFVLLTMISSACVLAAGGPFDPDQVTHEGVHYFLAKDRLKVSATVTTINHQVITDQLTLRGVNSAKRAGSVAVQTGADPSKVYVLHLTPRSSSDETMVIDLTETGLLKSINAGSTGRSGTILGNIFKFIGTVAGGFVPGAFAPASLPALSTCARDIDKSPFVHLPKLTRFTIMYSQTACDAWKEIIVIDGQEAALRASMRSTEKQLANATGQQLEDLQSRISTLQARVDQNQKDRAVQLAIVQRESGVLKAVHKIGAPNTTKEHEVVFDLNEVLTGNTLSAGATVPAVNTALSSLPTAKRLFDNAGVVIEVGPAPPNYAATTITPTSTDPKNRKYCALSLKHGSSGRTSVLDRCKSQFIFYRRPIATEVRIYGKNGAGTAIELLSKASLSVLRDEAPHEYLKFDSRRWSKGTLQITFDSKGVPAHIDWMAESSAAALTGALATAVAAARDEYAATIAKIVEIEDAKKKLDPEEKSELDKKLEELTKQKEVLDAQLALAGAQSTYELTLSQQQAAAELALVQSEIGLVAAEEARANQLAVLRLEADVARMNKELELLKAKIEIQQMNK